MLKISEIRIEGLPHGCITDHLDPELSFALSSDRPGACLKQAEVSVNHVPLGIVSKQTGIALHELSLFPLTNYEVQINAVDDQGERAQDSASFMTGRLGMDWKAKWITDSSYQFPSKTSPVPMTFRRHFQMSGEIKRALITATALGIYELILNGGKVGNRWFAPGFTSYRHTLLYQVYDVTGLLKRENELFAVVGGGWAAGRFTYESKSKITVPRQALLLELILEYEDGSRKVIPTDSRWQVTEEGNYCFGDFYDGEIYDATISLDTVRWRPADETRPSLSPSILCDDGSPVTVHEELRPVTCFPAKNGQETIYDFGQNLAGVIRLNIRGRKGQKLTLRHAEVLQDGNLYTASLRTAKQAVVYICREGQQEYTPRLTYMGFRYIGIEGAKPEEIEVTALVLHSGFEEIGSFSCSNELLNRLQSNVRWSGKSNFVDIPTDCPQRDERQGWTGDAAIFASTANFNFNLSRFWEKWLRDMRSEQGLGGGIPLVVPKHGNSAPTVATACWGDSCILVPWAEYLARGKYQSAQETIPCYEAVSESSPRLGETIRSRKAQEIHLEMAVSVWRLVCPGGIYQGLDGQRAGDRHRLFCKLLRRDESDRSRSG